MTSIKSLVNQSIIYTLKNHGIHYNSKGKVKFNRGKFQQNLNTLINRKEYPAHLLNRVIDDALQDMKNWKEYRIALKYLNSVETMYQNRNNRKIAYCVNQSNLMG